MKDVAPGALNFLDKRDLRFKPLHNSLDSLFRDLRTRNVGTSMQHAEIFTKEEEQMLWDTGVLGTSTPQSLLNAVLYMNGKSFCLRGGEEHRRLCLSQIVRQTNPDHYVYTEAGSKNKKGTFMEMHVPNKVVPIYSCPAAGKRCHVHLLDLYLSKLPKGALEKDIFYVCPLPRVSDPTAVWFQSVPNGKNQLAKMVPNMCSEAGIEGKKTNHSLRATAASDPFIADVPEKLIQERTGHKSVQALRTYQHTTGEQHQSVSDILASSTRRSFYQLKESEHTVPHPLYQQQPAVFNIEGCTVNISMAQPQPLPPMPPPSTSVEKFGITLDEQLYQP